MAPAIAEAPWVTQRQTTGEPAGSHAEKWMRVWIAIGLLVVLVVVGFLIGIVSALESINGNLAKVQAEVTSVGGDAAPLPDHVQRVNGSLTGIDTSLKPIPGQADTIIKSLTSVANNLTSVDNLLKTTSGTLSTVLGRARTIEAVLVHADHPSDGTEFGAGTGGIWRRVTFANSVLTTAEKDTTNILSQLKRVNGHLVSICGKVGGSC